VRRLLSSELLRFRSRRLVVVVFVGAIVGTLMGSVIAGANSTPPTDAVLAEARDRAREEVAKCLATGWRGVDLGGMTLEEFCEENVGNELDYVPSHLAVADLPAIIEGVASLTSILGLLIGASFVAASWQTGTIGTILTWEPRRSRWFGGRLVVLGFGVFVMTSALIAFLSAALAATAAIRGSTVLPDAWWSDLLATVLRVATAASIGSLIGAAIAAVGRHTAAALGVVFVWVAVLEGIVRALRPMWSPWLLGDNMVAFVSWMTTNFQVSPSESYTITPPHGVLVIGLYTVALVVVGFAFVRIRDVQ
jgi:ABC-2 type transport system permease protein